MDLPRSTALEIKLVALNDGDDIPERVVRLSADVPLTIGRASSNRGVAASSDNTKIENKVISKEHALIRTDSAGENVFIKDLKSMHGTKVDGVEVPRGEEVRVVSGAELQFGVNVIRGSETFRPAMYKLEYQLWDTRPRSPSPYFYKSPVDGDEIKRGYTDDMSSYSDNEDEGACVIVPDTFFEEVNDNGSYNETSSLFGEISENDSSYSEGEPEPEMDYPDESESEDAESDSESHDSTFLGPITLRSTTPPGGPIEIDHEEQESKAPEVLKRFQNSISDLVDEQTPTIPDAALEHLLHPEREPSGVTEEPHDEEGPQDKSAPEAVEVFQCSTVRRQQETFVDAHQKVDNLIADALAEVQTAQVQDSKSLESTRSRPQKRTADQAELDNIDTPQSNAVHVTKDIDTRVQEFPAEMPRKRTTAQYLRSFARDTTIFAAGSLAMLVGLAKLPNSLAP